MDRLDLNSPLLNSPSARQIPPDESEPEDKLANLEQRRKELESPETKKNKLETISEEDWLADIDRIKLDNSLVSNLILGFFVKMEMKDVSKQFSKESGISLRDKLENKVNQKCQYIRKHLIKNSIEKVIQEMKKISDKIFEDKEILLLELKSLKMLEEKSDAINYEAIAEFSKVDFLEVYVFCKKEAVREELVQAHERLITSISFNDKLPYKREHIITKVETHIKNHYDISNESELKQLIKLVYSVQKLCGKRTEGPKLFNKKFTKNVNIFNHKN